jgi:hypothetical protein
LACPFFMPMSKLESGSWPHPSRLPLGAGWTGQCFAPGNEGIEPSPDELHHCNLGYASSCSRLPKERTVDALRFSITRDRGDQLSICFVCEIAHRPAQHGILDYDLASEKWINAHPDARIHKMADCYLQSYLLRRIRPADPGLPVSAN